MAKPYAVAIVVDTSFGDRLFPLAREMPVWIVDTPGNRAAAAEQWRTRPAQSIEGVTTFRADAGGTPEAWCNAILSTVDLHHGRYSHDPPYTIIEVFGAPLTQALRANFGEFGLNDFEERPDGFRATVKAIE